MEPVRTIGGEFKIPFETILKRDMLQNISIRITTGNMKRKSHCIKRSGKSRRKKRFI